MYKDNLAKNIKALRAKHNLTQSELAEKLKITRQSLSSYEKGTREPDITLLIEMANCFNCSVDFLIFDNVDNNLDNIYENFKIGEFKNFDNQLSKYMISKKNQLESIINNLNLEVEKINAILNLIYKSNEKNSVVSEYKEIKIPILNNYLIENIKFNSFITTTLKDPLSFSKEYFIVTVRDESMNKIFNINEKIIIEKTNDLKVGDIGLILINNKEYTIKKIISLNNDYIKLSPVSENKTYKEELYDLNKVNIDIKGKYIINLDDYL
ncbi:helix-turn-helix domain-containing protein [Clostridium baratii]|uniref:XRE family transcriptional regulator n=1 Tax=Clostridium baratii TaxID=1561 RepID=A0A174VF40_9CLOT|nr:helix-turn-helix domain-containing protein [Clostridium baratii]CUQ30600.1 XRE family transcriptional regulator [Clostridium baratii]